jgi:hypothetical protein
MRIKTYFRTHTPEVGVPYTVECPFTETQTNQIGGVLTPEGLHLRSADKLVERWNRMAPDSYSYSLFPPDKATV